MIIASIFRCKTNVPAPSATFRMVWELSTLRYRVLGDNTVQSIKSTNILIDNCGHHAYFPAPTPEAYPGIMLGEKHLLQLSQWGHYLITDLSTLDQIGRILWEYDGNYVEYDDIYMSPQYPHVYAKLPDSTWRLIHVDGHLPIDPPPLDTLVYPWDKVTDYE